jgi:hypothetical protein
MTEVGQDDLAFLKENALSRVYRKRLNDGGPDESYSVFEEDTDSLDEGEVVAVYEFVGYREVTRTTKLKEVKA